MKAEMRNRSQVNTEKESYDDIQISANFPETLRCYVEGNMMMPLKLLKHNIKEN